MPSPDQFAETVEELKKSDFGSDETVKVLVGRNWSYRYKWLVDYDVRI